MEEVWKDIKGYEGLYQISNLGRVKSFYRIKSGKILKPNKNSMGYLRVQLKKNKKTDRQFVHRLVALHFIEKPTGKDVVNHLDCNVINNRVDNLEWTTMKGNYDHMSKLGRNKRTKIWIERLTASERKIFGKKVVGTSIETGEKRYYDAVNQVEEDGFCPSCVSQCCNGIRDKHKKYTWKFVKKFSKNYCK